MSEEIKDEKFAFPSREHSERRRRNARYKQCSAFWRDDKKAVHFRAVENFDEALAQTLLTRSDPVDVVTYPTGAKRERDDRKPRYDLISPLAEERIARRLAEGAEKYGARNWERGGPISRCVASALRHLNAYRRDEIDEDHLAATTCNLMFALHFEESVKKGTTPLEVLDLPFHVKGRLKK